MLGAHIRRGGSAVSSEENKAIVRRFGSVWGRGDPSIVDELAAADLVVSYPLLPEEVHGPAAFKQVLAMVHAALPDLQLEIGEPIAEGDRVAVSWRLSGTQRGDLLGIPATDKAVAWTGITIYRLAGGKVAEERGEEDGLGLLRQLGAIPG
jgi:steroid delta-isomerase-like uncharacterized protein